MITEELSFRENLAQRFSREELLEIIAEQDSEIRKQVRRIEWVFENKLHHLTWPDGSEITSRPLTKQELTLLIDEPFTVKPELTRMGLSADQQHQIHIARDPVLWARHFLNAQPRAYQIIMLRHPGLRKVLRSGRRLGKTHTMSIFLLHYAYTHRDGRCLIVAPMKTHVELIYQEMIKLSKQGTIFDSITRHVTSPQYVIEFSNGSTCRFFTSGMKSAGKADVTRGQEAHVIVLDELDYMAPEDLDSIYAMLQKTAENQEDKVLIGASTPTGQRAHFWKWCNSTRFEEFWFPSYCNPFFNKESEEEFREQYSPMAYRHEIEADWGEDVEGVYPRKYVDIAFNKGDWKYIDRPQSARSFFLMGVDWDKYGAGVNIVIIEVCNADYENEIFQNKLRITHREEVMKEEYTLTAAVDRVIELNGIFNPEWIYIDRGYGEVQSELLHKWGVDHPATRLNKKVIGVSFSEMLEMNDPFTKLPVKKEIKPFMVDNLGQLLEREEIVFPNSDQDLYLQLISYVVARTSVYGRPIFETSGDIPDHAHDALILACLAYTQKYGELMRLRLARRGFAVSNEAFLPTFEITNDYEKELAEDVWGSASNAPVQFKRAMTARKASFARPMRRKVF